MTIFAQMKIAILTSGILPIPAVKGGAVENLIDFYLEFNEQHRLHDITVYSVGDHLTKGHPALQSEVNHYHHVEIWSFWSKVRKHLHKLLHGKQYYHYTIEYYLAQALKDIRRKDYDVVIIENRPGYALPVAACTKARIVLHQHNDFLNSDSPKGRAIYDVAWRIITVSDYIGRRVKTLDTESTKCITVNNGIDQAAFSATVAMGISRDDLGLLPADFVLVYSGRINAEKGIKQLIEAVVRLKDYPDIKLLVLGSSFFGDAGADNPFISGLKQLAAPLAGRIVFTGFIPYSQMPGYLKLADVAVIPSMWDDPFPTSVIEAMCMGLPVIATQRGGIPEEASPENAILLPTDGDFTGRLVDAILSLYDDSEKRLAMGQQSALLSARFGKERFARDFFTALEF